jgi:glycosyltransferase involved in cell wall biosynthesis
MWRGYFRKLVSKAGIQKCAALMGLTETEVLVRLCQCQITFSVRDHLFLDERDIALFRPLYWLSDGYSVESALLSDIYGLISDYPKPAAIIPSGVDRALYHPAPPAKREKPTIRIGWVGDSSWGEGFGLSDVKGLKTIIRPSIEVLKGEGIDVELLVFDGAERWHTRDEVAGFYRELDLYICASSIEGTPNPVLEAMASGIPVVATRVGVVPHVFGPQQQSFIVERSIEAFSSAMRHLCLEPELRRRLAQENVQQIAKHDWATRAPLWRAFFADVIQHMHPDVSSWRRFMIEKYFLMGDN